MPDILLAAAAYLAFTACELDTSVEPNVFSIRKDLGVLYVRADHISGWSENRRRKGAPCVRLLLGDKTLYVLGPSERILNLLESHDRRP